VFTTDEQQHWYDCPYQVGTNSTDTPIQDATSHVVRLRPFDTIIIATDGLGDNLWDEEILAEAAGITESGEASLPRRSVQEIANALCTKARAVGEDKWGESPYMVDTLKYTSNLRNGQSWKDYHITEENWMISLLLSQGRNWMSKLSLVWFYMV